MHARVLVLAVVALVAAACSGGDGDESAPDTAIVFSAFHVPNAEACGGDGLWAVDSSGGPLRLVVGAIPHEELSDLDPLYPHFTPDGRSLIFGYFQYPSELPVADMYRMDVESGRVRPVLEGAIMFLFRWAEAAPVFVTARGNDLVVVDAVSGQVWELGRAEGPDYALDPTGSRLAYSRRNGESRALWLRTVAGGPPRRVAADGHRPSWSRDGTRLAFYPSSATGSGTSPLYVVRAAGGEARELARDVATSRVLWTDDEVLFMRVPGEGALAPEYDVGDLHAVPAAGGDSREVAEEVLPLEVSPDGQRLLFLRPHIVDGETFFSVRTMDVDGGGERVLAVIDEEDVNIGSTPAWLRTPREVAAATRKFAPRAQQSERCGKRLAGARDRFAGD